MLALKEEPTISLWGNCFVCPGRRGSRSSNRIQRRTKWRSVRSSARSVVAPVSILWTSPEAACGNLSSRFLSGILMRDLCAGRSSGCRSMPPDIGRSAKIALEIAV
jgi:hypothetical protein